MDERMDRLLRSLPRVEPPDELRSKVLYRVAEERRKRVLIWRVAYVATVTVLAAGGFWLGTALADSYLPDLLPLLVLDFGYYTELWSEVGSSLMEGALLAPLAAVVVAAALIVLEASRAASARVRA